MKKDYKKECEKSYVLVGNFFKLVDHDVKNIFDYENEISLYEVLNNDLQTSINGWKELYLEKCKEIKRKNILLTMSIVSIIILLMLILTLV